MANPSGASFLPRTPGVAGAGPASRPLRAYPKTAGDCPDFAESSEQNGTVPFSEAVFE